MQSLDWAILAAITLIIFLIAAATRRYTQSVADFVAANRCAGKYLLTVAEGAAGIGVITIIAWMEMYYQAGFAATWWNWVMMPIYYTLALTGWILYRFRETRCLTMAQFFEVRYSKGFRIFAGILAWISGLIFFGIFPGVGARFFIVYCDLPAYFSILGMSVSSFAVVMLVLVGLALTLTLAGGQIAVLVTDFFQGSISNVVFLLVAGFLLYAMDWSEITEIIASQPPGLSKMNPFDLEKVEGGDFSCFAISWFLIFYQWQTTPGAQTYNASAKSPHDARMGKSLSDARNWATSLVLVFAPVCAFVVLNHPNHAVTAAEINATLDTLPGSMSRFQMITPVFLSKVLPVGLSGLCAAAMFAAFVSTHDTFMHSLGTIFVQDVIVPLRKTALSTKQHLRLLRLSVVGNAIFVCLFSLYYDPTEFIFMFWAATGAIYLGGAGIAIIGGLYWSRGTTAAAYSAMIVGMIMGVAGLLLNHFVEDFPINGQWCALIIGITASAVYIVVSLFASSVFDMDRMLHRGQYAIRENSVSGKNLEVSNRFLRAFGVTKEFSTVDKCIYFGVIIWGSWWLSWVVFGSITYFVVGIPTGFWIPFWRFWFLTLFTGAVAITILVLGGGMLDLKFLFHQLKTMKRNSLDDGMVVDHRNLADEELISEPSGDGVGGATSSRGELLDGT